MHFRRINDQRRENDLNLLASRVKVSRNCRHPQDLWNRTEISTL